MKATKTQIDSFHSLTEPQISESQYMLYQYIKNHPKCTRQEASEGLNITINRTTARVNELISLGFVNRAGTKIGSSGRSVEMLEIN